MTALRTCEEDRAHAKSALSLRRQILLMVPLARVGIPTLLPSLAVLFPPVRHPRRQKRKRQKIWQEIFGLQRERRGNAAT
eukprot:3688458-Pleurochrysis_carterae.AAC.1